MKPFYFLFVVLIFSPATQAEGWTETENKRVNFFFEIELTNIGTCNHPLELELIADTGFYEYVGDTYSYRLWTDASIYIFDACKRKNASVSFPAGISFDEDSVSTGASFWYQDYTGQVHSIDISVYVPLGTDWYDYEKNRSETLVYSGRSKHEWSEDSFGFLEYDINIVVNGEIGIGDVDRVPTYTSFKSKYENYGEFPPVPELPSEEMIEY